VRMERALIASLLVALASASAGGEKAAKVEPKLAPDAALLKKVADLEPNTWMKLPAIKVTGDLSWLKAFNWRSMRRRGPYGRDYSNKAAWMPDRKRAIYAGGGHNVRPLNDVWEYDLASNTWVCLYRPDAPAQRKSAEWIKKNLVIKDGALQTRRSGPPRLSHTFDGWSYDAHRRVAFMPESLRGAVFVDHKTVAAGLGLTAAELKARWKPAPYFLTFDPYKRKWGYITENVPKCGRDPSARYISHLKSYWVNSRGCALYDPDAKKQKKISNAGRGGGYASSTVYDPDTRTVVVIVPPNGKKKIAARTWTYSCDRDEWKLVQPKAPVGGRSSSCYFDYSSKARACLLYVGGKVWTYDVAANEWAPVEAKGTAPPAGYMIGYYDPARDVLVHYNSRNVWVIRVRKPEKKAKKAKKGGAK
jgi:Kelch motif